MIDAETANNICAVAVFLLLVAFFLNMFNYMSHESRTYLLMNAIGGLVAAWCSWHLDVMPFVILEGTWGLIALYKFLNIQFIRKASVT
ncbi:hypothetical protein BS333_06495 [Vibrio azureus]|uniref:CBU-0592-like domain-containing protein n=1 Tax=Vibrio azureus NBRC 104587 TaxID=1219077 RepID=U3ALM9_9VIBR|nr:hypothetical protein [Vibrio azureus]AUI86060.1 hypothetical protein BS333_06495 [Vibrio azureus]GAD74685.1 hypothetical protein VAZ01S_013_00930 [Vibrio azureus NBRC 104587]